MKKIKTKTYFLLQKFIILNKNKEAGVLIKFIGISYIIFACFYLFGLVSINSLTVLSFSLSSILFILGDIINHMIYEWEQKVAIELKLRNKRLIILNLLKYISIFLGLLILIIGSFLNLNIDSDFLNSISTASSFAALGLAIYKMSLDYDKKYNEFTHSIINDFEKMVMSNSQLEEDIKILKEEKINNENSDSH